MASPIVVAVDGIGAISGSRLAAVMKERAPSLGGRNLKRPDEEFMGHSKIQTTFDVYGHLLPGGRDEVRERMDVYLRRNGEPPSA